MINKCFHWHDKLHDKSVTNTESDVSTDNIMKYRNVLQCAEQSLAGKMNWNHSLFMRITCIKIRNELNPLDSNYESINNKLLCFSVHPAQSTEHPILNKTRRVGLISTNYSVILQLKIKR